MSTETVPTETQVKAADPRKLVEKMRMAVHHDGRGITLTAQETRLLFHFTTNLYGFSFAGGDPGEYEAFCRDLAEREAENRIREGI